MQVSNQKTDTDDGKTWGSKQERFRSEMFQQHLQGMFCSDSRVVTSEKLWSMQTSHHLEELQSGRTVILNKIEVQLRGDDACAFFEAQYDRFVDVCRSFD